MFEKAVAEDGTHGYGTVKAVGVGPTRVRQILKISEFYPGRFIPGCGSVLRLPIYGRGGAPSPHNHGTPIRGQWNDGKDEEISDAEQLG